MCEYNEIETLAQEQIYLLNRCIDGAIQIIKKVIDTITIIFKSVASILTDFWNKFLYAIAQDKRIYYLAIHGKNQRIRNKNQKRLVKCFEKLLKENAHEKEVIDIG